MIIGKGTCLVLFSHLLNTFLHPLNGLSALSILLIGIGEAREVIKVVVFVDRHGCHVCAWQSVCTHWLMFFKTTVIVWRDWVALP